MNKTCKKCKSDDLYPDGRCKPCKRAAQKAYYKRKNEETGGEWRKRYAGPDTNRQAARMYGISVEEVESLRGRGKCDVCDGVEGLSIDHDHETGKVRGLLCRGCNLALGHVGDDVARLGKLIEYLVQKSAQNLGNDLDP